MSTQSLAQLPCLVLDVTDCTNWPGIAGRVGSAGDIPVRIPLDQRATVLQPNLATAEAEAKRLTREHPDRLYVVFSAHLMARTVELPTHTTIGGRIVKAEKVCKVTELLPHDWDEVPF